jgi:hypothetical protein
MKNNFQILISKILESINEDVTGNTAGSGGVFGSAQSGSEINNPTSINPDTAYTDNVKAAMCLSSLTSPKKKKKKTKIKVIKRNFPKDTL